MALSLFNMASAASSFPKAVFAGPIFSRSAIELTGCAQPNVDVWRIHRIR